MGTLWLVTQGEHSVVTMGNAAARQRLKFRDFDYIAKFTCLASADLLEDYYDELMDKYKDGKMQKADFVKIFIMAFPNKDKDKITRLADEIANKRDEISMANLMILLYLFCGGKMEDNLAGIFNLFDADGNKIICLKELYEVMSVFIEIAEGKENNVDLAKTMAEVFKKADANQDEVMDFNEFKEGMLSHPLTSKILREKTLDALLEPM